MSPLLYLSKKVYIKLWITYLVQIIEKSFEINFNSVAYIDGFSDNLDIKIILYIDIFSVYYRCDRITLNDLKRGWL